MDAFLFSPFMTPFTVALGLLFGLMFLELLAALLGGSILSFGGDADADFDLDLDTDIDAGFDAEIDVDGIEALEGAEAEGIETSGGGFVAWLGMGRVPFLIWLGAFLMAFGLGGLILQSALNQVMTPLPASLAAVVVAPAGLWFARKFSGLFARLLPKSESTALSENHLGRRRGVISQGTAARGRPAEVRVVDRHGNTHYLRAEPLRDDQEFAQGTEVLVMRKSLNDGYRLVSLSE